jgi:hemolysin III
VSVAWPDGAASPTVARVGTGSWPTGADEPSPVGHLYDSARDLYYAKPALRGWLHLVVFEASLVLGTLLIISADGPMQVTALSIYAGSVSGLFGVSALYHRGNWGPLGTRVMQRLDHTMIFVLIAGTATAAFLIAMPRGVGLTCAAVMWALTLVAMIVHLVWMSAPEKLVGAVFIGLGVAAGVGLPAVWIAGGVAAGVLMLAGGLLYIAGAVSYHRRRPDPLPAIFGYHEIFHTFVALAAACQYVSIALLV